MFCSKCGTKNDEGAKFCSKCGEALTKEESTKEEVKTTSNPSDNQGGIRKAMKKDAKGRVKGYLIGATAVYMLICIAISAIFGGSNVHGENINTTMTAISEILTGLVIMILNFGLLIAGFNIVKNKEVTFGDVFTKPFEKTKFLGYIVLLSVILFAIGIGAGLLMVIPILGFFVAIAFFIAWIYYLPAIETFMLILADPKTKEDITFDGAIKKALEIVKGHRVEYYGIMCSFIGWYLLGLCTFGILFIWLIPYIQITLVNMYRRWTGEESFTPSEEGLSNGAVVGITAGGCGCGLVLLVTIFATLIVAIATAVGVSDNPQIQNFINKYKHADQNTIDNDFENDLNEVFR